MENTYLITKVNNGICRVEKTVAWIAFSVMLALLVIQVACRYCFNLPLAWAEEMVRYTYIAVCFIGATVATRENSHICIDILPNVLKGVFKNNQKRAVVQYGLDILACLVGMSFWIVISIWMFHYNMDLARLKQITVCNEWPMWLMCLPITVSSMLMAIHSVLNAVEKVFEIVQIEKGGTK